MNDRKPTYDELLGRVAQLEQQLSSQQTEHLSVIDEVLRKRERIDEELREKTRNLVSLYENATEIIFYLDVVGGDSYRFRTVNPAFLKATGLNQSQVVGKWVGDVIPEPSLSLVLSNYRRAIETRETVHWEEVTQYPVGTRIGDVSIAPVFDEQGMCTNLVGTVYDITERKRVEEALKQSEKILAASQRQTHIGSFEFDFPARRLRWSEEMFVIFGVDKKDFRGTQADFLDRVHPDDLSTVERVRQQGLAPNAGILKTEFRIVRPDSCIRWVTMIFETSLDEDGHPLRRHGTFLDTTETKKADAERAELQIQLLQSQKMEAVGQLAGGIAHDFNNILAAIIMQLGMLQLEPRVTPDELREVVSEVLELANRAASLTKQLLLFSRRQAMSTSRHDANVLIRSVTKLLRHMIDERVTLSLELSDQPQWIEGDAGMIDQLVTNLCINARDAMPQGGRLTITTCTVVIDDETVRRRTPARTGRYICLRVSDTGGGIDPTILDRIFEPFFSTKPQGKGTGLGLATVHGIATKHGGFVEVESQLGRGSTFSVYLPNALVGDAAVHPRVASGIRGGSEAILVVEDEAPVRRMAVRCLRNLGYRVSEAANGIEALQVWEKEGGRFDLLFTDMVMPEGLSGLDLCSRLRDNKAGIKTIIASGYSAEIVNDDNVAEHDVRFLSKPYDIATLAATVRECLEKTW
jgi:two-component system cell cycle sensor histidine kinase/response regulator CckA